MRFWHSLFLTALALALAGTLSLPAQAGAKAQSAPVEITLEPGFFEGGAYYAALRLRLAPGWKTYWRVPGESGLPPLFHWDTDTTDTGAAGPVPLWPLPQIFHQDGMLLLGYTGALVVPLRLDAPERGAGLRLLGRLRIGLCDEICIPYEARLLAEFGADALRGPPQTQADLKAALSSQPDPLSPSAQEGIRCQIIKEGDALKLQVTLDAGHPMAAGEVLVAEYLDPAYFISIPQHAPTEDAERRYQASIYPLTQNPHALIARDKIRLTWLSPGRGYSMTGCRS